MKTKRSFKPFKIIDEYNTSSIPFQFRMKRFKHFKTLLDGVNRPVRILDVGGSEYYWQSMDFSDRQIEITLLNLTLRNVKNSAFLSVVGDATNLKQYKDKEFDLVFSNSVIEHLSTWENQIKMANEIRRVGKRFYIQTPNYYFPVEPHWWFPFFQFLPYSVKIFLTKNFTLGHQEKTGNKQKAIERVKEIRLLTRTEMQRLFPEAKIYDEVFMGLTKSVTAYYFP